MEIGRSHSVWWNRVRGQGRSGTCRKVVDYGRSASLSRLGRVTHVCVSVCVCVSVVFVCMC